MGRVAAVLLLSRAALTLVLRLAVLVAAVLALSPGAAHAATTLPPPSDARLGAPDVTGLQWIGEPVSGTIEPTAWQNAGTEAAEPVPTCLGSIGSNSLWYHLKVPEASTLEVTVSSTDNGRFQPVVQILTFDGAERACSMASTTAGAAARGTAYLPASEAGYLVRVARVGLGTQNGTQPTVSVTFSGKDVTPPVINLTTAAGPAIVGRPTQYNLEGTVSAGAPVDNDSIQWTFVDGHRPHVTRGGEDRANLRATMTWRTAGGQTAMVTISDRAGNVATYRFFVNVLDLTPPSVRLAVTSVPFPGGKVIPLRVRFTGTVFLRLQVTQGERQLLAPRRLAFYASEGTTRTRLRRIMLSHAINRDGRVVLSGIALDKAGNQAPLPVCALNAVLGGGRCFRS